VKAVLIVVTLAELAVLVLVLATYLVVIARTLRKASQTLGLVTFGVRAIEKQTEPIGPVVRDINAGLEQVARTLEPLAGRPAEPATATGQREAAGGTQPAQATHAPIESEGPGGGGGEDPGG
jgi:hypothetical protein